MSLSYCPEGCKICNAYEVQNEDHSKTSKFQERSMHCKLEISRHEIVAFPNDTAAVHIKSAWTSNSQIAGFKHESLVLCLLVKWYCMCCVLWFTE